jgi:hypothetical protein
VISDVLSAFTSQIVTLQAAVAGGITPSSVQNANYTLAAADLGDVVEVSSGSPVTVTIPPSATTAFPVGAVICDGDGDLRAVVSGRYACKAEYGLIGMMQRNEFARECRMIDRRGDRTHILVGTSTTLLPVAMLREVMAARRTGRLPAGYVYVPESLTEDFELTLAAKTLGWHTVSPRGCDAVTDVCRPCGCSGTSASGGCRAAWRTCAATAGRRSPRHSISAAPGSCSGWRPCCCSTPPSPRPTALSGTVMTSLPWALLTLVFIIDRVAGVRAQGRASMLFAALLVPEVLYNMFAQVVYVTALCKAFRGGPRRGARPRRKRSCPPCKCAGSR